MTELLEALGVIRHEPGGASPPPGLAQLPELAGRIRSSGLEVTVSRPEKLVAGVRTVASGDALLAPSVTRRLIQLFCQAGPAAPRYRARRVRRAGPTPTGPADRSRT